MQPSERPYAVSIILGTVCVALALLCVHFATRTAAPVSGTRDKAREATLIAEMVASGRGVWDSHPDADVSRVMQPGLREQAFVNTLVDSNRLGMREREYELPKPASLVRVVLLGDSFIFGRGVEADERLGAVLERFLGEHRGQPDRTPEVLHLGIPSWNLVSECSFVRRQLSLLRPDLVVHVSVSNDLADTTGVRGFGAMARHVPRAPTHGDSVLRQSHARWALDANARGHLARGLDHESRSRLVEAADHVQRLAREVERAGGRYLHVFYWGGLNTVATEFLGSRLRPEQVAWLPASFAEDPQVRISRSDGHWNIHGHQQLARFLYGLIQDRGLLPALAPTPWQQASELARRLNEEGRSEATAAGVQQEQRQSRHVPSELDMSRQTTASASLVHGGIDAGGLVAPYASILLARQQGRTLRVTGACLDRPELDGARMNVFADDVLVATVPLLAGEQVDLSVPLPPQVIDRPWISVRFVADDFVYTGEALRQCVSFRLERVAIEP